MLPLQARCSSKKKLCNTKHSPSASNWKSYLAAAEFPNKSLSRSADYNAELQLSEEDHL